MVIPAVLLALLGACNFNVLVVEVESKEVCVTGLTADIPGDAGGTVTATLTKDGAEQEGEGAFNIDVPEGWEVTEVTLLGVAIEAKQGIDNLHFVDSVHLDMTATHPEIELPPVKLVDIEFENFPYNTSSDRTTLFLEAAGTFNLVDYLEADELEFGLGMTGDMPPNDWSIGMDICFTFVAEYRESI